MTNTAMIQRILAEQEPFRLSILGPEGTPIGSLVSVTRSMIQDDAIIGQLTRWRNQAGRYFLTQFTATPTRTRRWLEHTVLTDSARLLFLIYAVEKPGEPLGYFGFTDLSASDVELGPLLRGERGGHPRLIYYAEVALLEWMFHTLHIAQIHARVFIDNPIPIRLHRSVGFKATHLIPMERKTVNDEVHLILRRLGDPSPEGLYTQELVLEHADFIAFRNTQTKPTPVST